MCTSQKGLVGYMCSMSYIMHAINVLESHGHGRSLELVKCTYTINLKVIVQVD